MLFPFWLLSSVLCSFPSWGVWTETCDQPYNEFWPSYFGGHILTSYYNEGRQVDPACRNGEITVTPVPNLSSFAQSVTIFLLSAAGREPEATAGNLPPLQQERGPRGRHAAGGGWSGEEWEDCEITRPPRNASISAFWEITQSRSD